MYVEVCWSFKMSFLPNKFFGGREGVESIGIHYKSVYVWFEHYLSGSPIAVMHRWGGPEKNSSHLAGNLDQTTQVLPRYTLSL